jgi:hypothetical protein
VVDDGDGYRTRKPPETQSLRLDPVGQFCRVVLTTTGVPANRAATGLNGLAVLMPTEPNGSCPSARTANVPHMLTEKTHTRADPMGSCFRDARSIQEIRP